MTATDERSPLPPFDATPRSRLTELASFLAVGGTGYVVDVIAFNVLLSVPPLSGWHPWVARCLAVAVAMVVTYVGNRTVTWRNRSGTYRRREVTLFVVFNLAGLAISVGCLLISHDLLRLTSRLDDNVSANGVGLALGTAFRFWSYRRFVFAGDSPGSRTACRVGGPARSGNQGEDRG